MILSDTTIKEMLKTEKIKIIPKIEDHHIRPAGIRVHLGNEILIPEPGQLVDITESCELIYNKLDLSENEYLLEPGMFILGSTYEKILTPPNIIGHLEGRSTVARVGMAIHCTSGIIDSMHDEPRAIVLEIKNIGNFTLKIKRLIPIGMLLFSELTSNITQKSQSQYRNQESAVAPNLNFQPKKIN